MLARAYDLFTDAGDPNIAIVNGPESCLHPRCAFRVSHDRTWPATLKKFDRITQPFHRDAQLVQRLCLERSEQCVTQLLEVLQTSENERALHRCERHRRFREPVFALSF